MELAIRLFIYSVIVAIVLWLIAIIINWSISKYYSKKIRPHPKDLAETYRKEITEEGRCPECGSENIKHIPAGTDILDEKGKRWGNIGIFDRKECRKCGYEWTIYPENEPDYEEPG